MKRTHFEASVCRESDAHDWRWFITWMEDGEWVSCLYDADADGLNAAVLALYRLDLKRGTRNRWLIEMASAFLHACELNNKIFRVA